MQDRYEVGQSGHNSCHILRNGWEDVTAWARKARVGTGPGLFDREEMLASARAVVAFLNGEDAIAPAVEGLARIGKSRVHVDTPAPDAWANSAHIYGSDGALLFTVWARRAQATPPSYFGSAAAPPGSYDQVELARRTCDIAIFINSSLVKSKIVVEVDDGPD